MKELAKVAKQNGFRHSYENLWIREAELRTYFLRVYESNGDWELFGADQMIGSGAVALDFYLKTTLEVAS